MGFMTANGVRCDRCRTGPIEVKVEVVVIVDIDVEDACTTRREMGEVAEKWVESNPQFWLKRESQKKTLSVEVEALGCG